MLQEWPEKGGDAEWPTGSFGTSTYLHLIAKMCAHSASLMDRPENASELPSRCSGRSDEPRACTVP